jgi:hypothetical protein
VTPNRRISYRTSSRQRQLEGAEVNLEMCFSMRLSMQNRSRFNCDFHPFYIKNEPVGDYTPQLHHGYDSCKPSCVAVSAPCHSGHMVKLSAILFILSFVSGVFCGAGITKFSSPGAGYALLPFEVDSDGTVWFKTNIPGVETRAGALAGALAGD